MTSKIPTEKQESRQGKEETTAREYLPHYFSKREVLLMLGSSEVLQACLRAMAKNIGGLGYDFIPLDEKNYKENDPAIKQELEYARAIFSGEATESNYTIFQGLPLQNILYRRNLDYEAFGLGGVELVPDKNGNIAGIYHIPIHNVYLHSDGKRYIQRVGEKTYYFSMIGGEPIKRTDGTPCSFSDPDCASELWVELLYQAGCEEGVPRYAAAYLAVTGNYFVSRRNVNFFQNYAVPLGALVIIDGDIMSDNDKKSPDSTKLKFKEMFHGVKSYGKLLFVKIKRNQSGSHMMDKGQRPDAFYLPFEKVGDQDASFREYQKSNDERIRNAYQLSKIGIGISDDVNLSNARIGSEHDEIHVYQPERQFLEYQINTKLLPRLGIVNHKIRLSGLPITDKVSQTDMMVKSEGFMTVNEQRIAMGMKPLPYSYADDLVCVVKASSQHQGEPSQPGDIEPDKKKKKTEEKKVEDEDVDEKATRIERRAFNKSDLLGNPEMVTQVDNLNYFLQIGMTDIRKLCFNGFTAVKRNGLYLPKWWNPDILDEEVKDYSGLGSEYTHWEMSDDEEKQGILDKWLNIFSLLYGTMLAYSFFNTLEKPYQTGSRVAQEDLPGLKVDAVSKSYDWLKRHAYDKIYLAKRIATQRVILNGKFSEYLGRGMSLRQIIEDLNSTYFPSMENWQLPRISQTEIANAWRQGYFESTRFIADIKYSVIISIWERACDYCRQWAGGSYTESEIWEFLTGTHPHCQCTIEATETREVQ